MRGLLGRGDDWTDGRRQRTPRDDAEFLVELRQEIAELLSYGYRRACALVNERTANGAARVNAKRVYRVMAGAGLLLPRAPRRRQSARTHECRVAVTRSDLRWCSYGLEIKCDSGQTVTATGQPIQHTSQIRTFHDMSGQRVGADAQCSNALALHHRA